MSPVLTAGRAALRRRAHVLGARVRTGAASLFDGAEPIPHTRLGQRADLVVVAPATAKLLGKYAGGISDDLLTATLLATRPVLVAPGDAHRDVGAPGGAGQPGDARGRGVHVVDPEWGRLAGGDVGEAASPIRPHIVAAAGVRARASDLAGVHVLVTAGGTREPIDPVRVIGNRSSGKMGYAIAEVAARRGAAVTLVTTIGRPAPRRRDRHGRDRRGDGRGGPGRVRTRPTWS